MKMVQPHRIPTVATLILLVLLQPALEAKETKRKVRCPIGFLIAYSNIDGEPICYRLKGPEKLTDKYVGCTGNLYTSKLYNSLNMTKPDLPLWTEYKSLYPGGPFIDYSYTKSIGTLLETTFEVVNPHKGIDEELCVVIDPVSNYMARSCDEDFYRYCLVEPYIDEDSKMPKDGCDKGYMRFWSPKATCLLPAPAAGGGAMRAHWNQAKEICERNGTTLLYNGWRYSNNPRLHVSGSLPVYPLGITYDSDRHSHIVNEDATTPPADWHLEDSIASVTNDIAYGAIRNDEWILVNSSHVFFDVICEQNIELKQVELVVSADDQNKLVLTTEDKIDENNIYCFTDSKTYTPSNVKISYDDIYDDMYTYVLKPIADGYYWCVHTDSKNFTVSESNKALWVREEQSLKNKYAVKLALKGKREYRFENIERMTKIWEKNLKEYIFYSTNYYKINGGSGVTQDPEKFEGDLKDFKSTHPDLNPKEKDILYELKVKKLFLDAKTVVFHLNLHPNMKPVQPATWDEIEIVYMKPVYYCVFNSEEFLESITIDCMMHSCVGNFNDGVQVVTTKEDDCEKTTTEVPTMYTGQDAKTEPTLQKSAKSPSEQLDQVMEELQNIINNETVSVNDINSAFDQVDKLLAEDVDLSIPGQLLHLLDGVGSRLDLAGSENATAIRGNIALLVANADPNQPVKGLRIAARDKDNFTDNAFEILRDEFNAANLQLANSEAVVQLPDSVATSSRRISFVVFRNDRAFYSSNVNDYFVNSRVLSVNVENVTEFEHGETVEIHFSSIHGGPERNQSRACGFWKFSEGDQGHWSQEGCTFIRATRPGLLDTCRCNHLTHFAEILVPRAVFSEQNELALEILSVIGCCLSLFGLVMIGITAALFRSWRRDFSNKIWLQLCIAIFGLIVCFLVIVFVKFEHYGIPCMLVGVLLHYSVLASFCWMLVAAVLSYRRLVLVFTREASHKLLRASAFSWGVPCAIVGILLSVAPQSYAGRYEDKTPTGAFCYPSGLGLWLAVYAPIAVMLLANWTLFVLIVRSVFTTNRGITRHGDSNEAVRCASVSCLLVFLFGLPWIFGLFAYNIVLAYLFALTATFQGFVLFIFFVCGNKKTRDLWFNKLRIKQTRKVPVTSSTYTNRSTQGPAVRAAPQTSVEAKVSQPKSLATTDDSRHFS